MGISRISKNREMYSHEPYAVIGSGQLVSHIQVTDDGDGRSYRFNLFRLDQESGESCSWLSPTDIRNLVKTCQVLAFTIADDGWLPADIRQELFQLTNDLDGVTRKWSDS